MSVPAHAAHRGCTVEALPAQPAFEFVAFRPAPALLPAVLPSAPGAVGRDASGGLLSLHFAPGRWLLFGTTAKVAAEAADLPGTAVDVTGKWQALRVSGPGAQGAIAAALDLDAALAGRDCAAVTLFDSPAIVARDAGAMLAWVQASTAEHCIALLRTHGLASPA